MSTVDRSGPVEVAAVAVPVVAPHAVDAYVYIESVRVDGRRRRDLGDVASLARSIRELGMLLHPITLTRDCRLISGYRRLEACRRLGWVAIPARFVDSLDDAARLLRAEQDEDTERKDLLPSELAALGETLYEFEASLARARMAAAGRSAAPGRPAERCGDGTTPLPCVDFAKARHAVGVALGMSGRTYGELTFVHRIATDPQRAEAERELAQATLTEMDRLGCIAPPARRLRAQLRANQQAAQAHAATLAAPDEPQKRSFASLEERLARIAGMAVRGYTSMQIAADVGVSPERVRYLAREHGIELQADAALGRSRKSIDSNRVVRETAATLDGLLMGIGLVDVDALDAAEIDGWVRSLTASIRVLNGLIKQMKERTQ